MTRLPFRGLLAALALLALAAALAACQETEESPSPDPTGTTDASASATAAETSGPTATPAQRTPGPGETLYRWANLTLIIPEGSGFAAGPGAGAISLVNRDFVLVKSEPEDSRITSTVVFNGDDGAIVEKQVAEQHREEVDRVIATLRVGVIERTDAPWPYNGEPSSEQIRESAAGVSYIRPSPATGLYVGGGIGDPGGEFISIRNERSVAFVQRNPVTSELVIDSGLVIAEDKPIFDRWLATVQACNTESAC